MNYAKLYVQSAFARFASYGATAFTFPLARLAETRSRVRRVKAGADDRNRTGDLVLTKDALCQLSYIGQFIWSSDYLVIWSFDLPIEQSMTR